MKTVQQYDNGNALLYLYPCPHCGHTLKMVEDSKKAAKRFRELFGPEPYEVKEEDIIEKE